MSVTNRKMFRRDARNKVRQMGGIMASSEPLIQAVANYQLGGGVNIMTQPTNQMPVVIGGPRPRSKTLGEKFFEMIQPKGIPGIARRNNVATMAGSGVGDTTSVIDPRYVDEFMDSDVTKMGKQIQETGGFGNLVSNTFGLSPSGQLISGPLGERKTGGAPSIVTGQGVEGMDDVFKSQALQAQKDAEAQKLLEAETIAMREAEKKTAVEGGMPDPAQTGKTDEKALEDALSGGRSSIDRQTLGVTADEGTEYEHKLVTDQFRKDGNLNNVKETVQNTVKSGVGTGGALKQLINEFTSNAPEYEGMDRGLAIAKIGFAMAAGESPNAITNIANALSQGADMFLKDDEKRRDFKRQVELAGLQYGIGELSKMRAEGRALARQDRNLKYFVAGKDIKVNGVSYEEGSVVPISEGYIRENGIPSGLTTENLVKGAQALKGKIDKLLAEQNEKKIMSDKDYRANREIVTNAAAKFEESRNLMTLIEGSIYKVAGGEVTGLMPKVEDLMNRAFQAAGVNRDEEGQTLAEYNRDMQEVANKLIKEIIQEGGKNISNVDRQLAQEIVGLFTRRGGYITEDPDVLLGRLQSIHRTLKTTQTKAVADMTDMLELSIGRTFQSGAPVTYSRVGELQLGAIQGAKGGTKDIFLKDLLTDGQVDAS